MKKRASISLIANLVSCVITLGINFILTPYYTRVLGDEAYGYVGLANSFITYASIVTIAFNAMAQRFVTVSYHQKKYKEMNTYFWSVFISDVLLSAVIVLLGVGFAFNLEHFFSVPERLLIDVKWTFFIAILNFALSTALSVYSIAYFTRERVEIAGVLTIAANFGKLAALIPLLYFFVPKISYIAIGGLVYNAVLYIGYLTITKKLLPEVHFQREYVQKKAVFTMLKYGIWSSLTRVSGILLNGLDLLIAKIAISGSAMGILSVSKVLIQAFDAIYAAIASVFHPRLTRLYAENNISDLILTSKRFSRYITLLLAVPSAGIIAYGDFFYRLWMPYRPEAEIYLLYQLTALRLIASIANFMVEGILPLPNIYAHVKVPTIISLANGAFTVSTIFLCLKVTNWGIYALAGIGSLFGIVTSLVVQPIYVAHVMNLNKVIFIPMLIKNLSIILGIVALFLGMRYVIPAPKGWMDFLILIFAASVLGYSAEALLGTTKDERKKGCEALRNFIRKKKK
ncbi:lipopolysaccharide biosynthesis protein [Allofournierella sp.]|uniref:lipopolysaccharide biosynthesis protein n=1 Tax=Allofournierella sp. TaxID=1940256 RepID=UPI003AB90BE4